MDITNPSIHGAALAILAQINAGTSIKVSDLVGLLPDDLSPAEKALLAQGVITLTKDPNDTASLTFEGTLPSGSTVSEDKVTLQFPARVAGHSTYLPNHAVLIFDPAASLHGFARGPFGIHIGFRVTEIAIGTETVSLDTDKGLNVVVHHG